MADRRTSVQLVESEKADRKEDPFDDFIRRGCQLRDCPPPVLQNILASIRRSLWSCERRLPPDRSPWFQAMSPSFVNAFARCDTRGSRISRSVIHVSRSAATLDNADHPDRKTGSIEGVILSLTHLIEPHHMLCQAAAAADAVHQSCRA